MTLSEVPLDVLNRFAAMKCGWTFGSDGLSIEPTGHYNAPLPDLTQPAGMKMLLERMCRLGFDCVLFNGTYHVELDTGPSDESGNIRSSSSDLGRAVLEAFVISEGFQVEGA